jgi:response regulator of citrate/malate metabolism
MDDYLSKPLHFESMVKILEKWAKAIQNKVA